MVMPPQGTPGGLRERKKAATRRALHRAAVDLVAELGYDGVTVEAIADAASVSRRTFSNYFAGKREALLHGDQARIARLLELVRERPEGEGAWPALAAAAEELLAENDDVDPDWLARRRTLRGHPELAAGQVAGYAAFERDLATELRSRLPAGPDVVLRAHAVAAVFLTVVRVATDHWTDHWIDGIDDPQEPLVDVVRRTLAGAEPAAVRLVAP